LPNVRPFPRTYDHRPSSSLLSAFPFRAAGARRIRIEPELIEEQVWERRREFLLLNADGSTPVLVEASAPSVPGANVIANFSTKRAASASATGA